MHERRTSGRNAASICFGIRNAALGTPCAVTSQDTSFWFRYGKTFKYAGNIQMPQLLATVEFMDRMAEARDTEGVTRGFVRLTMACADCHRHMRTPKIAERELLPGLSRQNQLARLQPDL